MIVEKAVRTSGYAYPLRLETAILREYVLEPVPATQAQTEKLLQEAWRRAVQAQMLAGRIDATQESLLMQGGTCASCRRRATARAVPARCRWRRRTDKGGIPMSERIINAERIEQIINVFGSFDENIKRIEQTYGVKITNRGTG